MLCPLPCEENSSRQFMTRLVTKVLTEQWPGCLKIAYWVGMAKDVGCYCNHCTICQITKASANQPAPLQPIVASRPWEMVAVDIHKVLMSSRGNQYLLAIQDYFSKWPFAIPLPDQKAERIVQVLKDQAFTLVGPLHRLTQTRGGTLRVTLFWNCVRHLVSPSPIPHPTILWEMGW